MVSSLRSITARKRIGRPHEYGVSAYGLSAYGVEFLCNVPMPYGVGSFGVRSYGDYSIISGVYQVQHMNGRRIVQRVGYMVPKNPRSVPQQANRGKFGDAVAGWQGLSEPQKEPYRVRAKRKKMSGYNLFLKEYMLTP